MIRKATTADVDFLYRLYMHPQVNPFLLYEEMSKQAFEPVLHDLLQKQQLYIYCHDGVDTGMFKLVPLTYRNDHIVYLGGLAIQPALAGKGAGQQMLHEIIAFVKEQGYKRVELTVATINEKAINLYEKSGFLKEGVLKNFTWLKKEQRFLDEVVMAYLL